MSNARAMARRPRRPLNRTGCGIGGAGNFRATAITGAAAEGFAWEKSSPDGKKLPAGSAGNGAGARRGKPQSLPNLAQIPIPGALQRNLPMQGGTVVSIGYGF